MTPHEPYHVPPKGTFTIQFHDPLNPTIQEMFVAMMGAMDYSNPMQVVKVARWLKPRATRYEGRLRGLKKPAKAGFVNVAGGFSLTASHPA